jgi:hypothetical protein
VITDDTELALLAMSPATMDRLLAPDRAKLLVRGRSHTKPGSVLKDSIPIRTWAEWNDAVPGFVEIDLVGHEGGNAFGEHCYTLTVTDKRSLTGRPRQWSPSVSRIFIECSRPLRDLLVGPALLADGLQVVGPAALLGEVALPEPVPAFAADGGVVHGRRLAMLLAVEEADECHGQEVTRAR